MASVTPTRLPAPDVCVSVASAIARSIVADAIWHEDRCSWVGAMPEEGPAGSVTMTYQALGPDLYGGTAGVGVFLAELARVDERAEARRTALGALRQAASRVEAALPATFSGFYAGVAGVAFALAYAARLLEAEELDVAARAAAAHMPGPEAHAEFDLMSGHAGAIVGLLALRTLLDGDEDELLARAGSYGDALITGAEPQASGLAWHSPSPLGSRPLVGYSHGTAGVATTLLELAEATGDDRYRSAAEGAFAYERALYDPDARNWPDLREHGRQPGASERAFATFWCHGAPGIALSRLRALELGEADGAVRDEAERALRTTTEWLAAALPSQLNYSLCHGLAGNAEIVGEGALLLGNEAVHWLAEVACAGINRYHERDAQWPSGAHGGPTPALFLGDAGIGRFYLRLAHPDLPSLLLVRPQAVRGGARVAESAQPDAAI
jgi:lantibiotic modifying enzyme